MRSSTALCSSIFVLALAAPALWSDDASATALPPQPPVCGDFCESCVYTPARYTAGAAGTVALTANSGSVASDALAPIATDLGMTYYHSLALYDASGNHFTETEWNGVTPPSSDATSGTNHHPCSRIMDPFFLSSLSPGAVTDIAEDAVVPATLIAGFATAGCSVPRDGYHLTSIAQDSIPGGSCEKLLVDYCGTPVLPGTCTPGITVTSCGRPSATGDRQVYNGGQIWAAVNSVFNQAYGECMQVIGGTEAFNNFFGISGLGCGSSSEQTMCQRAGWQAVNEILFLAYPIEGCPVGDSGCGFEAGPLAPSGTQYYLDGWSDFHTVGQGPPVVGVYPPPGYNTWTGTMLGAGKMNYESSGVAGSVGSLCPGANNTTGANNAPLACPNYQFATTANLPDNIANAAGRLGRAQVKVTTASGYAAGYSTCHETYCCKPGVGE
jgi:hypothetical protein